MDMFPQGEGHGTWLRRTLAVADDQGKAQRVNGPETLTSGTWQINRCRSAFDSSSDPDLQGPLPIGYSETAPEWGYQFGFLVFAQDFGKYNLLNFPQS